MAVLPMFPLGTVLVPGGYLPLHVFEERYRALVHDCLQGPGEFGVVLIERGSEVGGGDTRSAVGTVARIVEASRFDDGRWALAAVGVRRIRVLTWLPDEPYPRADVEDWPDPPPDPDLADAVGPVAAQLRRVLAAAAELGDAVAPATIELRPDPLQASYDAVTLAPIGPADRQRLLRSPDARSRLAALAALLEEEESYLARRLALGDPPSSAEP